MFQIVFGVRPARLVPFSFARSAVAVVFFCPRGPGHAKENEVYPLIGILHYLVFNDRFPVKYNCPTNLLLDPESE